MEQEGRLSKARYEITLMPEYFRLYQEAIEQRKDATWTIATDRGREFPSLVDKVGQIDLRYASSADIGYLITYFSNRDKAYEEITNNIAVQEILVAHS